MANPRSQAQQKILKQIEAQGHYKTTSDRSAKVARSLSNQGVQHIFSCELDEAPGKTTHRFAKRQHCR
ncbi:hypothetical protein [Nodosilinea sp. FACHB-13]|uniref:hypothetical protein n=1 Tax=Cyanophyceae TaxID=3028117 RepID=UPI0016877719|nr:hypothetical protein [Nodosilinea sp. FACHB-13]MBD2107415.1 hypothetical protein [Nodosilinea sp. FACHB-13]